MLRYLIERVRSRLGRRPGPWPVPESDLWTLPGLRLPPPDIVRRLREIDPLAVLVDIGLGRWLLGTKTGTSQTRGDAEKIIAQELTHPVTLTSYHRIALARLHLRGLVTFWIYEQNDPDGRIVEHFREADWLYRHQREATFAARMWEGDSEKELLMRQGIIRDYWRTEAASAWRFARGRRSFTSRALKGAHQ